MSPDEEALLRDIGQMLDGASRWERDVTGAKAGPWMTAPGSELEADDAVCHPYTVSAAAWGAITAAVSHLVTLRDSLFLQSGPGKVQAQIHIYGQLTLVRGALENASLAFWLLEDNQSNERIVRRMQEDWEEVRQLDTVRTEIGQPSSKTMADREREMTQMILKAGGDPRRLRRRPSYSEIVKIAGASQASGASAALVTWKACSSIAHGELRGALAYLKNSSSNSTTPGMQLNEVTGNIELTHNGCAIAISTLGDAMRLYKRRSGTNIPV